MQVIIVGGGWAGCAAALQAAKMGARATLLERTDMLLGTGLVGGIMRNNGRFTATEELIAMGGGEIFQTIDTNYLHKNIQFPGHDHASLYNVATMEPIIKKLLLKAGVEILCQTRVTDAEMEDKAIRAVLAKNRETGETVKLEGDAFIDTTGTAGPMANCTKYGKGCAMCVLRCHSFGGRVSLAAKAGVQEMICKRGDQTGAFSGSCKLFKESLAPEILETLNTNGVVVVPLPKDKALTGKLAIKACQQYALPEFANSIVLLDTGHAKLMTSFFPLDMLRQVPGFETARFEDPYSGGIGNSVRYMGMSPRDDSLKVKGVLNLFCGGEKAGLLVGHTEAICTGVLAGHNAVKYAQGKDLLILPEATAIGDAVRHVRKSMQTEKGMSLKYTFSGSVFFERMKEKGLYSKDPQTIAKRVNEAGVSGVFNQK